MRVTKTIREYIEKEVATRITPKYETEKLEAERQSVIEQEVWENVLTAMQKACDKILDKAIAEYDFLEDSRESGKRCVELRKYQAFGLKDRMSYNNVHRYKSRMNDEIKKTVDEIVVELELGGTKAELIEMLDKVGQA